MTLQDQKTIPDGQKPIHNPAKSLKNEKLRRKKKASDELRKSAKANLPPKDVPNVHLPAAFVLPKPCSDVGQFADDDLLLAEIKRRTNERNAQTLRVRPVPKRCPPAVLQDFAPSAICVRPPEKGSRLAFFEFRNKMDAQSALLKLNGQELDGTKVIVTCCADRPANEIPVINGSEWKTVDKRTIDDIDLQCLYVSSLPRSVLRTDLAQLFRSAISIKLPSLPDGTCAGHCILRFKSREEAVDVFANLHHTIMRGIPIYVNFKLRNKSSESRPETVRKVDSLKRKADDSPTKTNAHPEKRARSVETVSNEQDSNKSKRKHNKNKKISKTSAEKGPAVSHPIDIDASAITSSKKKKRKNKNKRNKPSDNKSEFSISKSSPTSNKGDPQLRGHQLTKKSENKKKKQKKPA